MENTNDKFHTTVLSTNIAFSRPVIKSYNKNSILAYLDKILLGYKNYLITPFTILNIIKVNPDIIHIHSYRNFQGDIALLYGILMKKPIVLAPHGSIIEKKSSIQLDLFKKLHDFVMKPLYVHFVSAWIATSSGEADDLLDFIGPAKKGQILKIILGIDKNIQTSEAEKTKFRERFGLEKRIIITYVGRIHQRKGIQHIIQAMSRIRGRLGNIMFLIIGPDDGYLEEIKIMINELDLADYIKIIGYLEKKSDQLYAAYACSDVLIVPSKFENFGHIFVEAAILRTPIITSAAYTDVFGEKDVLRYKYGDVDGLSRLLSNLREKKSELVEKSSNFFNTVIKMNDWRMMTKKYEILYDTLISAFTCKDFHKMKEEQP